MFFRVDRRRSCLQNWPLQRRRNGRYCGLFLFTADDKLENSESQASPRDNVIFEAGYFMRAKGKEKVLIVREKGAKMPADIGGNIYLPLNDRNNISAIHADIQYFLENRIGLTSG